MEFLGKFLLRKCADGTVKKTEVLTESSFYSSNPKVPKVCAYVRRSKGFDFYATLGSENKICFLLRLMNMTSLIPLNLTPLQTETIFSILQQHISKNLLKAEQRMKQHT